MTKQPVIAEGFITIYREYMRGLPHLSHAERSILNANLDGDVFDRKTMELKGWRFVDTPDVRRILGIGAAA